MQGFAGGLNLRDAPTELKPSESPSCWNVTLDERGGVVKRLGYAKWNASAAAHLMQDGYYSLLMNLLYWYSPADGKLYSDPGTGVLTLRHTFTAGSRISLVDFAGAVYASHPVDGLFNSTNGTTWNAVSKGGHSTAIPVGSLLAVWQNKLWIAGDPSHINRLYYSAPGDATDWDPVDDGGSVDVREKDDAPIIALHGGSGYDYSSLPGLFVFKNDSLYRVQDSSTGAYVTIDTKIGAAGKNSVSDLYGELIFISRRGIYQTKKLAAVVAVAEQVLPLFDPASLDDTTMANWCAGYWGDRIYFSMQRAGASGNDIALEYAPLYGWVVAGSNAMGLYLSRTGTQAEVLIGASPTVTGQMYQINTGGKDDTAAITSWYETRWFQVLNGHNARMNLARLLFRGTAISVTFREDFAESGGYTQTLTSETAAFQWDNTTWGGGMWNADTVEDYGEIRPRQVARAFKIRIDEASTLTYSSPQLLATGVAPTSGAWALYSIETQYAPLGLS